MKLTVKTLKGNKFEIEVDDSKTVAEVKTVIVRANRIGGHLSPPSYTASTGSGQVRVARGWHEIDSFW